MVTFKTSGTDNGTYRVGDGEYSHSYSNVSADERAAYLALLQQEGYTHSYTNQIGDNLFDTFYKGKNGLHLSYYPAKAIFKVTTITKDYQPATTPATGSTAPTLTQMGLKGADLSSPDGAPGMSYVMQLSDGRFIIVDGGSANADDELALLNYLKENSSGKPRIAAWVFTHAHGDHMGLACSFISKYANEVTLQAVYANFPDAHNMEMVYEDAAVSLGTSIDNWNALVAEKFPNAAKYKFHAGEKFYIGDALFEILFTHEDFYPMSFGYGNDTSSAFKVTLGNKSILFLGDCDSRSSQFLADVYGSALKCDILQVTHHGFNGAVQALYESADPTICLWPVDQTRFGTDPRCLGTQSGYEFNKWLRDNVSTHHHTSVTTTLTLK